MSKPPETAPTISNVGLGVLFMEKYCKETEYFTSEEALRVFLQKITDKELETPPENISWSNLWGAVLTNCVRAGYCKKAGRTIPTSRVSHATTTSLWMSRIFVGERTLVDSGQHLVEALRQKWVMRKVSDLRQLLMMAYEGGFDQGVLAERKEAKGRKKLDADL
jgi:hypothetical protein